MTIHESTGQTGTWPAHAAYISGRGRRKIGMDTGRLFMSQCDRELGCTLYGEILSELNLKVMD